ncbi:MULTISPECIES: hypothetical protein [unclassified Streptomyces]|uniref:hypothetical protein n=1 Tax=unclassified Streptomyces TaxID=2593676 RepID=UPI003D9507DF
MNDTPSPADMPPRSTSPSTLQRNAVRNLVTGLALKLSAQVDPDLDALEVLAKLLDAQTRAGEFSLRLSQRLDAKDTAK